MAHYLVNLSSELSGWTWNVPGEKKRKKIRKKKDRNMTNVYYMAELIDKDTEFSNKNDQGWK